MSDQSGSALYRSQDYPWRDESVMRHLYEDREMTHKEIGEELGCAPSTVTTWMKEHGIDARDGRRMTGPWQDGELMEKLYVDQCWSTTDIADLFDCSTATVNTWLNKHGIEPRGRSEAISLGHGYTAADLYINHHKRGYVFWEHQNESVPAHRLLAVAEYGFDAVCGKEVHHKNGIAWDNRPANIELHTPSEHKRQHLKVDGVDRMRVAELYEHGDISIRDLAEELDFEISSATVRNIHKECYGGVNGD